MNLLNNFFNKKAQEITKDVEEIDLISDVKNWYSDRYESAIIQRNSLFLLLILAITVIFFGIFILGKVASSKTIDPFIVQIEQKTGITNVVNPLTRRDLTTNEALNTYFIVRYITARETYDPVNFDHNYKQVARVLSSNTVYREFLSGIGSMVNAQNLPSTTLAIRSIQFLEQDMAQVRFTITGKRGEKPSYKIASIKFIYAQMEMNIDERLINPLGFRITNYRVDDEIL